MPELLQVYKRQRKYMFFLLFLYLLGVGIPSYRPIFLGLLLGTTISLFNLRMLAKKTLSVTEGVQEVGRKKYRSLGTTWRMAAALAAVMIATKYPAIFNLLSVIIGIVTCYVVIMIDLMLSIIFDKLNSKER
ncbi:ATP synthase subunit I [Heyndrickxia ginsengihumi]|uniref:ATP synthase I n=1 Tax=Heyndrickxia ginsengihumi TaxID=363870 RepID=A0A0A6VEK6_9BACI|nr:ATP synthase subunit I [Heyndrickxia ginsengihumi]KHD86695.1 ATP synthase I [Heyndrickxia ginsengihumi]MBE6184658.1 ATP synthase subunit I [Bacillus sp. (in: firmicutes)]MCM3022159.1 ATP synthase subunit I [Heyndrickxia ginsengihumi]NEY18390.1 ATP synthase subunit I [Heyndrickxia ginsengihumi]